MNVLVLWMFYNDNENLVAVVIEVAESMPVVMVPLSAPENLFPSLGCVTILTIVCRHPTEGNRANSSLEPPFVYSVNAM